jgi:hypothetical protein
MYSGRNTTWPVKEPVEPADGHTAHVGKGRARVADEETLGYYPAVISNRRATSWCQVCCEFLLKLYLHISLFTALNFLYVVLN